MTLASKARQNRLTAIATRLDRLDLAAQPQPAVQFRSRRSANRNQPPRDARRTA